MSEAGSIDDEELRTGHRRRPVRLCVVGDLVAHAGAEDEFATVGELDVQLAVHAEKDVPLRAPVIGAISGRVLDDPDANAAELPRAPESLPGFSGMDDALDARPGPGFEGDGRQSQVRLIASFWQRGSG